MKDEQEKAADVAAEVLKSIENGEMTLNQARDKFGLEPDKFPTADEMIKKA